MKVENMKNRNGNKVPNQFIIDGLAYFNQNISETGPVFGSMFQSYESNVAFIDSGNNGQVYLDKRYWDYSRTTGKYRNLFLGETKKETEKKIETGEYILTDLN